MAWSNLLKLTCQKDALRENLTALQCSNAVAFPRSYLSFLLVLGFVRFASA